MHRQKSFVEDYWSRDYEYYSRHGLRVNRILLLSSEPIMRPCMYTVRSDTHCLSVARRPTLTEAETFNLTAIARALGVPQHRLIHLCQEGVIVPDHGDAQGRGSRRGFSRRNVFELAVAVEMRRLEVPVSFVRAVIEVLRVFESELGKSIRGFALPESLRTQGAPRVSLLIVDGERLLFRVRADDRETLLAGITIPRPNVRGRARAHRALGRLRPARSDAAAHARTRTEVDLTQIARDISIPESH